MAEGKLFIISGASGVGKSTVLKKVMDSRADLQFSVSATTRAPRPGEQEGVSYYFVSKEQFEQMIQQDAFLEYDAHNKNYYGTPTKEVEQKLQSGHMILDIEPVGAFNVRKKRPDATLIFIEAPSWEELERRLRGRGDTPEDQIALRLERAKWELEQKEKYDYVVVNDQAQACAERILHIIAQVADGK
ncbi:MAG: guanylate kinase [Ruminococcaceae bacterium]|nr:guanylate kinase [Oscillospiraceae bacterium]